jgi:hypothetical protein
MMRTGLLSLVLLVAACGSNRNAGNSNSNPGGDSLTPGDVDASDPGPQCGLHQILNGHGECITVCQSTPDCNDLALECNLDLGVCIPKPAACDPAACACGSHCPVSAQGDACVPLDPGQCNVDCDCSLLERCSAGSCTSIAGDLVKTCAVDGDCPLLMVCKLGVCIGCVDDLQCTLYGAGNKCVLGTCVTADLGTAGQCINKPCAADEVCALSTGECTKKCTAATAATDCTVDQSCLPVANYCVAKYGCTQTADCVGGDTGGRICLAGLCTNCTDNDQCLASEICVQPTTGIPGACFPNLTGNVCDSVDCGLNKSCDPANGSCYPTNGSCTAAADCRPTQTCSFLHMCSGCTVDGDCRPNQKCLLSTCIPIPSGP